MPSRSSILAVLLLVAACGGGVEEATTAPQSTTQPPVTEAATTTSEAAAGVTVTAIETGLGAILTDQEGRTLYLFFNDAQGTSVCNYECEANWTPLLEPANAGEGVNASLLGTAERSDGSVQVTYNGWPLYYFAGDFEAGDVNGQGVSDVWWLVSPAGEAVKPRPEGPGY